MKTIQEVTSAVSDLSDEELQEMHDDVAKDVQRFIKHVGLEPGIQFLKALVSEMKDRKMEVSLLPAETKPPQNLNLLQELMHPKPQDMHFKLNRKQRRALQAKARKQHK